MVYKAFLMTKPYENNLFRRDKIMIEKEQEQKILKGVTGVLVVLLLFMTAFNSYHIHDMTGMMTGHTGSANPSIQQGSSGGEVSLGGVVPTGVPETYGEELGVSYDDVDPNDQRRADQTIRQLAVIDQQTELQGDDLQRYINILYHVDNGMSCEYCCGARSIIFENGQPACGCAHSFAMRGLAKYLILEHGDSYTDKDIQEEVAKWKVLFFPGQSQAKAEALELQGIETTHGNIASNQFRGIEQGSAGGGMVGGC